MTWIREPARMANCVANSWVSPCAGRTADRLPLSTLQSFMLMSKIAPEENHRPTLKPTAHRRQHAEHFTNAGKLHSTGSSHRDVSSSQMRGRSRTETGLTHRGLLTSSGKSTVFPTATYAEEVQMSAQGTAGVPAKQHQ